MIVIDVKENNERIVTYHISDLFKFGVLNELASVTHDKKNLSELRKETRSQKKREAKQ